MKKKIILIALIGAVLSTLIYFYTKKDGITITSLGDSLALGMTPYNIEGISFNNYLKEYYQDKNKLNNFYNLSHNKETIKELIYEIKENKPINLNNQEIEIQRAINEADILTIAIGIDELSNIKINRNIIKEYEDNIKELLSMIKVLNKNKIIVLGLYTIKKDELLNIMKLNAILKEQTLSNNFIFIDVNNILNQDNYYFNSDNYYINYLGHKAIYKEIKNKLK